MLRRTKGPVCPFLKGPCIESDCRMWVRVSGRDPQSGESLERWDCSFALAPMLQLEIAGKVGGVQEAVVSHRNEHVSRMDEVLDKRLPSEIPVDYVHQG